MKTTLKQSLTLTALLALAGAAHAQSTAFTYQGRLQDGGTPATGPHDFEFRLFTTVSGPVQVGATLLKDDLGVTNGLFTAVLDFGAAVFPGGDRFLQIAVRPGASTGAYTNLAPRQMITATPYAVKALEAETVPSDAISTSMLVNNSVTSAKIADGTIGRQDINIESLNRVFWVLGGNPGTSVNSSHLGTTDNVPLSLMANTQRILKLEPNETSPNLIGGFPENVVSNGVVGAVIAGGGLVNNPNRVGADYASVLGGFNNTASGFASTAIGLGGRARGDYSTVIGAGNVSSGEFAVAMGADNTASGNYSIAMGTQARALHPGSFVWSDLGGTDFTSTAANQFAVRAAGGMFVQGRLSVGRSAPGWPLDVQAGQAVARLLTTNNAFGAVLVLQNISPSPAYLGAINFENTNGTPGQIGYLANNQMSFRVGGQDRMTIHSSGLTLLGAAEVASLSAFDVVAGNLTSTELAQMHHSSQSGSHTFTGNLRQMLSLAPGELFGSAGPGLGLQTNNFYFRSHSDFSWFRRGTHRDTPYDAGGSLFETGTELMRLSGGYLSVRGAGNEQSYFGGDGAGGDIEIGSRNAAIMSVGFWNPAAGQHMNVFARTFNPTSDRHAKQDFRPVDAAAILEKVVTLPITEWAYKGESDTRHVGPVAQDFKEAFGVGGSDKSIATVDADGVALAAIQGLNQKLEAEVKSKDARIAELEKRLAAIESRLQK